MKPIRTARDIIFILRGNGFLEAPMTAVALLNLLEPETHLGDRLDDMLARVAEEHPDHQARTEADILAQSLSR